MRTVRTLLVLLVLLALVTPATPAGPLPGPVDRTGTHVWWYQKACNRFVLTIAETGLVTGYDDNCGQGLPAGMHGAAFPGGMALTRISPDGSAVHVYIRWSHYDASMGATIYPEVGPASALIYLGPVAP